MLILLKTKNKKKNIGLDEGEIEKRMCKNAWVGWKISSHEYIGVVYFLQCYENSVNCIEIYSSILSIITSVYIQIKHLIFFIFLSTSIYKLVNLSNLVYGNK